MLRHPRLPSCATCQKYMVDYDWQTGGGSGEIQQWGPPSNRQSHERSKDCPPPCHSCPKKGPQHEHEFVLNDKNWRTLEFYRQTKATFGRGLTDEEARDEIVRKNFSVLDQLFAAADQEETSEAVSRGVTAALRRAK
jgi:hypothetical protein